jgi:phosphoserine phosphatase RsbU/P
MSEIILIVDDSGVNRKLLNRILAKEGYQVAEAVDGEEALAKTLELNPDLLLLDVMMPKMDGYEACAVLKEDERTRDIPIIFLSAKAEAEDKIHGLDLGGVDYITKPFDPGEVLARVRNQLKIRSLTQQILRANEELLEKQRRLEEDLKAAAGIQESLLPEKDPGIKNVEFAWRYETCDRIGGDIFNVMRLDEHNLAIYMLDVSGHGVPAALVTVSVHRTLSPQMGFIAKNRLSGSPPLFEIVPPGEVLHHLDEEYPIERFEKFFTIVYMILNSKTGTLHYSNAAHPHPILIRADGSLEALDKGGTIIGMGGSSTFEEDEKQLNPGEKLILYTDGLTECENEHGEFFGEDRFRALLQELKHEPVGIIVDCIIQSLTAFIGKECKPRDDISLLGLGFHEWEH